MEENRKDVSSHSEGFKSPYRNPSPFVKSFNVGLKKKRLCLRCGKKFSSKGPHNRVCGPCTIINDYATTAKPSRSTLKLEHNRDSVIEEDY